MALKAEVFDSRRNVLGEGPTSSGANNNHVMWVDIYGKAVRWRNLDSGEVGEYQTPEDVGFVIPLADGGELLGTAHGPHVRDLSGSYRKVPGRVEADGYLQSKNLRWNDAKVSPDGDLWLGSMALSEEAGYGSFYRLDGESKELKKMLSGTGISNGLAWSSDKKTFYYIDTLTFGIEAFDYHEREISNRRMVISCDTQYGFPDGMCIDSEDGLWVAFYNGSAIRRYDTRNNFIQTHEINVPALRTTSCAFAGKNLEQLTINSFYIIVL